MRFVAEHVAIPRSRRSRAFTPPGRVADRHPTPVACRRRFDRLPDPHAGVRPRPNSLRSRVRTRSASRSRRRRSIPPRLASKRRRSRWRRTGASPWSASRSPRTVARRNRGRSAPPRASTAARARARARTLRAVRTRNKSTASRDTSMGTTPACRRTPPRARRSRRRRSAASPRPAPVRAATAPRTGTGATPARSRTRCPRRSFEQARGGGGGPGGRRPAQTLSSLSETSGGLTYSGHGAWDGPRPRATRQAQARDAVLRHRPRAADKSKEGTVDVPLGQAGAVVGRVPLIGVDAVSLVTNEKLRASVASGAIRHVQCPAMSSQGAAAAFAAAKAAIATTSSAFVSGVVRRRRRATPGRSTTRWPRSASTRSTSWCSSGPWPRRSERTGPGSKPSCARARRRRSAWPTRPSPSWKPYARFPRATPPA